jgi:hypothetical protein
MRGLALLTMTVLTLGACTPPPPPQPPAPLSAEDTARHAYEMQERCGRTSREWFKDVHGNGTTDSPGFHSDIDYENHFNARLNGCFAMMSGMSNSTGSKNGKVSSARSRGLIDVNESRKIGAFYISFEANAKPLQCYVNDARCTTEEEWNALIKPYMER